MDKKIKVGDTFYVVNESTRSKEGFVGIVTKVGKKYFYIEEKSIDETRVTPYRKQATFYLDTKKDVSDPLIFTLYNSEQEYLELKEKRSLWSQFQSEYRLSTPDCSLDDLIKAIKIIKGES